MLPNLAALRIETQEARTSTVLDDDDTSSDEDVYHPPPKKQALPAPVTKTVKVVQDDDSDDEEQEQVSSPKKQALPAPVTKTVKVVQDDDSDDEEQEQVSLSQAKKIRKIFDTFPKTSFKSTEAEAAWLRSKYGTDWYTQDKARRIIEARVELSRTIAPQVEKVLETREADVKAKFKEAHYYAQTEIPKLSWPNDVLPYLKTQFPNGWTKDEQGNTLSEIDKGVRSDDAKKHLREEKLKKLEKLLEQELQTNVKECVERMVDELNFPKKGVERKAKALCRYWFNRIGTDGKTRRVWHSKATSSVNASEQVTSEMQKDRLAWAKKEVQKETYDPTNPPQPEESLYALLDVKIEPSTLLPDPNPVVSKEGGQWLWKYMRALEANIEKNPVTHYKLQNIDDAEKCWTQEFRATQKAVLKDAYGEFIESINDLSEIPDAKDVAKSYTQGSGKFNKYLLWPSKDVDGDPTNIPAFGKGTGGVAGNAEQGQIGPPDSLHRLYKVINRCPRLTQKAVFIRSVKRETWLPHNLGKSTATDPVVGKGYLNVTFMSTTTASPEQYLEHPLSTFYDISNSCCMYAITAGVGMPLLPLVLGGNNLSSVASEQEVLFPPGLLLVYQGKRTMAVNKNGVTVHFYEIALPPAVQVP